LLLIVSFILIFLFVIGKVWRRSWPTIFFGHNPLSFYGVCDLFLVFTLVWNIWRVPWLWIKVDLPR
jgi:hypothetical protein